ncbi:MAG: hydrogenase accessory protein HypB [gamma proteobacterium symbiont of Ctena orbiculata]|nr:MAG: hydrogenase accessory protein HypB [gamma proteobacterium symbiont of Ctena orbiculata]PVV18304.1 MAG: hydrogenase accessory protein HypB [gamma proteobacterium symbiont of Ctena orbiculata]
MCDTCGCNITEGNRHLIEEGGKHAHAKDGSVAVEVLQNLLSENDHQATHNREHFDRHQLLAINLMSSPGSGKTRLLETTIDKLGQKYRIAVVEGDLETENDAERIRKKGVAAVQITTGTACHLDAHMIHQALHRMDLDEVDILFIENVGNLVCPASFDLGQHLNITLLSVTEGDDKPIKYPVIFRAADLVLLTKSDLLAVMDEFSPERAEQAVRQLAVEVPVTLTSAKSGEGFETWLAWLEEQIRLHKARRAQGKTLKPNLQPEGAKLHAGEG